MGITAVKQEERNWVISLSERFDFGCVEEFRRAYESIPIADRLILVVDFKNTRYMDSSALGMLINAKSHLSGEGTKISLTHCNDQIKKIFSISRFEKKFDIS